MLIYPFLLCFLLIGYGATAQNSIPKKDRFAQLLRQYQQRQLNDTSYMKAVDSVAAHSYDEDSLDYWLSNYKQIAFSDSGYGKWRVFYYRHLINLYDNKSKYGSAIYYSEKNNAERVRIGLFEKDVIPHSDLYAMATYTVNKDYARVFAKYVELRPLIVAMPADIVAGKKAASPDGVSMAFAILEEMGIAARYTRDSARLNEAILFCEKMLHEVRKQSDEYKEYMTYYHYIYHDLCFRRAENNKQFNEARTFLNAAIREVEAPDFGEVNYPEEYAFGQYCQAFDFYFSLRELDSAQLYANKMKSLIHPGGEYGNDRQNKWLEAQSKLQAIKGQYEEAYTNLQKAYEMKAAAYYAVNADKDNNLYALSKAEDTYNDLVASDTRQQQMERFNMLLFAALGVLIFAGTVVFFINNARQKRRLYNLQLSIARNFHDEIGPLVLYAGILAKKEAEAHPSAGMEDLKVQVRQIMESVRSISHDLKSSKPGTVSTLHNNLLGLLKRIKASTEIDFSIRLNNGKPLLSNFQFTHLLKICSELITNSIKHADCSLIIINLRVTDHRLYLLYSDNGKGIAHEPSSRMVSAGVEMNAKKPANGNSLMTSGIGMQNIRERVAHLKGDFHLNNDYPVGYSIEISVPLL